MEATKSSSSGRGNAPSSSSESQGETTATTGAAAAAGRQPDADRRGSASGAAVSASSATSSSRESDSEEDITLGPGWLNRSGSRSLSGSREVPLAFIGKGGPSPISGATSSSSKLAFCYTKEEVLALHNVGDDIPSDFLALPYILSQETLAPVNLSSDLIKDFEELQRKYLYNICPSRGSAATRGGRGRGRGRGRGTEAPMGRRDKEGSGAGGSAVYRPPRGRGRAGYSSWDGENERRPAWADTPVDKDQPKGRFRGGRFRGDSDSEGSASEPEQEDEVFSDAEEAESDGEEAPGTGWMYKDPQNIVRGPFSNKEMHEWFLGGFFPRNLPIKRETDEDFKPLSSYEGNPFAPQRKKKPATKKDRLRDNFESESKSERGGRDWGDWRSKRSDKGSEVEREVKEPSIKAKKADEAKEKPKDDGSSWRSDIPREGKKEAEKAAVPASAPTKEIVKKDELTPVEKKVEEMKKASKEAEQTKKEKQEKQSKTEPAPVATQPSPSVPQQAAAPTKVKSAGAEGKRDSIDVSDTESLDDILDHFPHLNTDFVVSSDDEGEERTPAFLAGAGRTAPGGIAATPGSWASKPAWTAQELEMRQFQQFAGPNVPGAGEKAAFGQPPHQPPMHSHMHPHPTFPEAKGPYMQPHHPLMGPGQPPQQFFPGIQPGFPPHSGHPIRPGAPAGPPAPHHIPGFERRQGVFDMAAIEEQLLKQSQMPVEMHHQRMPMQQPHMPPHGAPGPHHPAPWMVPAIHAKQAATAGLSLREIQEQELRERQQRHQMPPQAFPHHLTPEQMLHHQQMMSEQHKHLHPLLRQQMAMGMRPSGQIDPVFQSVWGIPPETPLSIQELQTRLQNEREEEQEDGTTANNETVEQELHDNRRQEDHEGTDESEQAEENPRSGNAQQTESTKSSNDEEGIWDVPVQQEPAQQKASPAKPQRADAEKAKPGKKQAKQKKKGAQATSAQQQQSHKNKTGGQAKTEPKPPSLREIQEQEQREMMERQKQQKQAASHATEGESKNLQHFLSAWGFAQASEGSGWGSSDETHSLKEIQEQEAAQRELAQMEEQQKRRQQMAQQTASAVPALTGAATKKPTLSEIQAEEMKEQQKRQKEMQKLHKQQLKAQREQQARWNSPWAAAQAQQDNSALSLREIQELEQRRALEEASRRKKSSQSGSTEPITKLLWETRIGANEPVPLAEIMAQEQAASFQDEVKPKKEAAPVPEVRSDEAGVWQSQTVNSPTQTKANLRDIQQEEHKAKKKGQQQPSGQSEKSSNKKQTQSPQKGNQKKVAVPSSVSQSRGLQFKSQQQQQQLQQQQQQGKGGVWGVGPAPKKVSLLDIQEKQQRVLSPPPASVSAPVPTPAAPKSAPAPVVEDDFWGAPETPAPKSAKPAGDTGASAPTISDDSHFPALGGANNTKKAGGGQQKKGGAQPTNWTQKPAPAAGAGANSGARGARLSSSSDSNQQAAPARQPKQAKQPTAAAGKAGASGSKKKMQKLDPSLLGFSTNVQERIAQGQVLPVDQ